MEDIQADLLLKRIKSLNTRIYLTRKSRINTEDRLIKKNNFYQFINVYYSIVLVFSSILNLQASPKTSLFLLSSSIALSLFSLFVISKNLTERQFSVKFNYIRLQELLNELDRIEDDLIAGIRKMSDIVNSYEEVNAKYISALSSVENQEEVDYLNFIKSTGFQNIKLDSSQKIVLCKHAFKETMKRATLIIAPIIAYLLLWFFIS
ncbi:hypothetical protein CEY16_13920 [Halalkalibacillus sediminis]|uniref:SMODS and SLOG-associating 2TM effector domain-containing protein n=1 Tax=Halalkalibacillus sediminis TaxID=2018042 RepID=A0A2I0QS28_9BACI|nr:SLATT domain-containing protein [Halalkalibacillus sediminis]PKR76900.1 hypothetical protein CEY16_13920 [Halalkalibacillus sediminis]